jgi:hypothetical protein
VRPQVTPAVVYVRRNHARRAAACCKCAQVLLLLTSTYGASKDHADGAAALPSSLSHAGAMILHSELTQPPLRSGCMAAQGPTQKCAESSSATRSRIRRIVQLGGFLQRPCAPQAGSCYNQAGLQARSPSMLPQHAGYGLCMRACARSCAVLAYLQALQQYARKHMRVGGGKHPQGMCSHHAVQIVVVLTVAQCTYCAY